MLSSREVCSQCALKRAWCISTYLPCSRANSAAPSARRELMITSRDSIFRPTSSATDRMWSRIASDRVDVAPGSDVVREDDQLDRLGGHGVTHGLHRDSHDSPRGSRPLARG